MEIKMAKYITRNNEICQEFFFASPRTKILINNIYNMRWYGSSLWDLNSDYSSKIESFYNRSIKIMADLPYGTHRFLIETISKHDHIRKIIWKRYIKFIMSLGKMKKPAIKILLDVSSTDAKTITGRNIRSLRLETGLFDDDINIEFASLIRYHDVIDDDLWMTEMLDHLLEEADIRNLDEEEKEWISYLCTN